MSVSFSLSVHYTIVRRDSLYCIVSCYDLFGRGSKTTEGRDFTHPFKLYLVPTQSPMQWLRVHSSA